MKEGFLISVQAQSLPNSNVFVDSVENLLEYIKEVKNSNTLGERYALMITPVATFPPVGEKDE